MSQKVKFTVSIYFNGRNLEEWLSTETTIVVIIFLHKNVSLLISILVFFRTFNLQNYVKNDLSYQNVTRPYFNVSKLYQWRRQILKTCPK